MQMRQRTHPETGYPCADCLRFPGDRDFFGSRPGSHGSVVGSCCAYSNMVPYTRFKADSQAFTTSSSCTWQSNRFHSLSASSISSGEQPGTNLAFSNTRFSRCMSPSFRCVGAVIFYVVQTCKASSSFEKDKWMHPHNISATLHIVRTPLSLFSVRHCTQTAFAWSSSAGGTPALVARTTAPSKLSTSSFLYSLLPPGTRASVG